MPLSSSTHYTSAGLVRPRRSKEKDSRSVTSNSSSRKHKESSRSRTETASRLQSGCAALDIDQNASLEQLPPLPESGTASPGSATSPDLRPTRSNPSLPLPFALSHQFQIPAALQQFLDTDEESDGNVTKSTSALMTSRQSSQQELHLRPRSTDMLSLPLDSQTATPLAANSKQTDQEPMNTQKSPSFFDQANKLPSPTSKWLSPDKTGSNDIPVSHSPSLSSVSSVTSPVKSQTTVPDPSQVYPDYCSSSIAPSPSYSHIVPYHSPNTAEAHAVPPHYYPYFEQIASPTNPMLDFQPPNPHMMPTYPVYGPVHQPLPPNQAPLPLLLGPPSSTMSATGSNPPVSPTPHSGENITTFNHGSPLTDSLDEDTANLLHRVSNTIPDLTDLVHRYHYTSTHLRARDKTIRQMEVEKAEKIGALGQKENYIEKLNSEFRVLESRHAADTSKLRLQIGNMEEKHRELHESVQNHERTKLGLETAVQALQAEKESLLRTHHEEKSNIQQEYDDRHRGLSEVLDRERRNIEEKCRQELKATLDARLAERDKFHAQEKKLLETSYTRQLREVDANHETQRRSLEKVIVERKRDLEDARALQAAETQMWQTERAALLDDKSRDQSTMHARLKKEKSDQDAEHQRQVQQMRSTWDREKTTMVEAAKQDNTALQTELGKLRTEYDADKAQSDKHISELKDSVKRVTEEKDQLSRVVENMGKVTDLKGRGDPFYDASFQDLQSQVIHLASQYFRDPPHPEPSKDILRNVPVGLPELISHSASAQALRAAYIQHIIMTITVHRIFEPLLFILQASEDKTTAEALAQVSSAIKNKSTMKESCWRQQTLFAIYSSVGAKEKINRVANQIINEIYLAIRPFTISKWNNHILEALRKIIKTTIEVWRYASMEPARISASMSKSIVAGDVLGAAGDKVALVMFPRIFREQSLEDLRNHTNKDDEGYVYTESRYLAWDDPICHGGETGKRQDKSGVSMNLSELKEHTKEPTKKKSSQCNMEAPAPWSRTMSSLNLSSGKPVSEGFKIVENNASMDEEGDFELPLSGSETEGLSTDESGEAHCGHPMKTKEQHPSAGTSASASIPRRSSAKEIGICGDSEKMKQDGVLQQDRGRDGHEDEWRW